MEYIYSALILHESGKEINENNVTSVLKAAEVEVEDVRVKALVAALDGVDIEDALKSGAAVQVAAAAAVPTENVSVDAVEAEVEEDDGAAEEAAVAGLGDLFG
jgi:large subunit ribosomal protein L12